MLTATPEVLARDWALEREENHQKAAAFLARLAGRKVHLLGFTPHTAIVAANVKAQGGTVIYCDDTKAGGEKDGAPILAVSAIKPGDLVINTVFYGRLVDAEARLEALGADFISYPQLHLAAPEQFPLEFCGENTLIGSHVPAWQAISERFEDEVSRDSYLRILAFRMTFSTRYLDAFTYAIDRQYFEPFLAELRPKVFIDGGSFDGATSRMFAERYPNYEAVHLFEPNPDAPVFSESLLPRMQLHPYGLGAREETVSFDSAKGSASAIAEGGSTRVEIKRLDQLVTKADWIKLDVEGADLAALHGAEGIILRDKPVISIAVYHRQPDMWQIPEYLLTLHRDYRMRLKHYSRGLLETVMFFY